MKIGVPKEIKDKENRVALTPEGAKILTSMGNEVLIEKDAGLGSGFSNEEYSNSGAKITEAKEAWNSDIVVKVKEPLESEYGHLNGQILFTYLHLSGVARSLTEILLKTKTTATPTIMNSQSARFKATTFKYLLNPVYKTTSCNPIDIPTASRRYLFENRFFL